MTETAYAGLILGGPKDGEWITCSEVQFKAPVIRNVPVEAAVGDIPRMATRYTDFEYQYFEAPWGGKFWIPKDVVTEKAFAGAQFPTAIDYVMQALVAGYRRGE